MKRTVVFVAVAAVASALAFVAIPSARADHDRCWRNGHTAYPFPYPNSHGSRTNLPECRRMAHGTTEKHARLSMQLRLRDLKPNPGLNGRIKWRFVDSLGKLIYTVEKSRRNGAWRWIVRSPGGKLLGIDTKLDRQQFILQGRGCMVNDRLERKHAIIAFQFGHKGNEGVDYFLYNGASRQKLTLRAFVNKRAVDSRYWDNIQRIDTGCGRSKLPILNYATFGDPGFSNSHKFVGEKRTKRFRSYSTYNANFGGVVYVLANTTGIRGGGIVRAVVRAGDPTTVAIQDAYGYCDPNVPRGKRAVAGWWYGAVAYTRISGYIPVRAC